MKDIEKKAEDKFLNNECIDIVKFSEENNVSCYEDETGSVKNGRIEYKDDNFKIYINPSHSRGRKRFTIAHELSHFFLHKSELIKNGAIDREDCCSLDAKKEREADELASKILMPRTIVLRKLEELEVNIINSVSESLVLDLADFFKVSFAAMAIRLRSLNFYVPFYQQ